MSPEPGKIIENNDGSIDVGKIAIPYARAESSYFSAAQKEQFQKLAAEQGITLEQVIERYHEAVTSFIRESLSGTPDPE